MKSEHKLKYEIKYIIASIIIGSDCKNEKSGWRHCFDSDLTISRVLVPTKAINKADHIKEM